MSSEQRKIGNGNAKRNTIGKKTHEVLEEWKVAPGWLECCVD
jgi:hypothetical protein